jgi:hypothetical protein
MKLTKLHKEAIVRAIMNDVPKPDKAKRRMEVVKAIIKAMSPECRKVYLKTPSALATQYVGDLTYDGVYEHRQVPKGDVPATKIDEILKPYQEEDTAREHASRRLRLAIDGCSTLKQLQTALPEFKKYYPTEMEPTKNLPALANVVADLSKLGWPKK